MVDDDERVDEDADHGDDALVVRVFYLRHRMGVRSGAHTGLVGEQAALGSLAQRRDDAERHAADRCLRVEGAGEDELEGAGMMFCQFMPSTTRLPTM